MNTQPWEKGEQGGARVSDIETRDDSEARMKALEARVAGMESFLKPYGIETEVQYGKVMIDVLPGGRLPERKTDGAIGYDVYSRVIVSPHDMDPEQPHLRRTLFDFSELPDDPNLRHLVHPDENSPGKLKLTLPPGQRVLVGVGFITAMDYPMMYWLAPRSGLSSRDGITLTNTPGTVDPDYRGEAGAVLRNDSDTPWDLRHESRIAQLVFGHAFTPELVDTPREEMPATRRGSGGFGSTGFLG